jgi:hypothetical protein
VPCTTDAVRKARQSMGLTGTPTVTPLVSIEEKAPPKEEAEEGPGSTMLPSVLQIQSEAWDHYEAEKKMRPLPRDNGKPFDRHFTQACYAHVQEPVLSTEFDALVGEAAGLQPDSIRQCRRRLGPGLIRVEDGRVLPMEWRR